MAAGVPRPEVAAYTTGPSVGELAAGLRAVLVRTGKYRSGVVAACAIEPAALVDSIADVPAFVGIT